jgi:ribosomal-protein-alanine N-acetyltransferase
MSFMRERAVDTLTTETMRRRHLRKVLEIEEQLYPRPWTNHTFVSELSQMRAGNRYYLVAYVGDTMVGYAGLMFAADDAHVTNIAVHPEWQRRGIATDLLLELAWKARERECQALTLEVRMSNTPAQELYRRFGFVPAGVRKKYYENVEDAMVMWCHEVSSFEYGARLREIEMERANAHR